MSYIIALVSGEGQFEKVDGYYAGWGRNEYEHPDGFKLVAEKGDAQKFETLELASNVIGGDPRLKGARIFEV